MAEDSTFNLSCSTGWTVDWDNPIAEERKDRNTGDSYTCITFIVTKDREHDWRSGLGEDVWYKHSNEVTLLKHASFGDTLVCL